MTVFWPDTKKTIRIERGENGYLAYLGTGDHGRQSGHDPFVVACSFEDLCEELKKHLLFGEEREKLGLAYAPWFKEETT